MGLASVADYLRWWLGVVEVDVCPRTFHRYEQIVRLHLVPVLGRRRLVDLGVSDIEEAKAYWLREGSIRWRGRGLNPQSVVHNLRVLHVALEYAVRHGKLLVNPVDRVKAPHVDKRRKVRPLNVEAGRRLELLEGHEYEHQFTLALLTA